MRIFILIITVFLFGLSSSAQPDKPIFLGLQPGITKEPFYPDEEFDVNVLPFVFLTPLSSRVDFRATTLVNYHLGGNEQVSDLGVQTVYPIYFVKKDLITSRSKGFYCGPVLGVGYNALNKHTTVTMAIEPGYIFKAEKHFTLSIGIQLGASYFKYKIGNHKWQNHWGPKVNLGWWIN